ncbi:MAG: glycosyltransferase family 39 protein [Chloroflexota bacterium]
MSVAPSAPSAAASPDPARADGAVTGPAAVTASRGRWLLWLNAGRRTELLVVLGIGLLALLVRLAFSFRAPPFVTNDSLSYLLPGFDLLHGGGFAPILKRPPLYPLFVGGVLSTFGEELRVLVLVQHLLGVVTVLLAYGIGRLLFGPAGAAVGALLTALSGPAIVTEQYLMSEGLFTVLLAAGLLAYLAGVRCGDSLVEEGFADPGCAGVVATKRPGSGRPRSRVWLLGLAGALLALAALTRPLAQLVLLGLIVALPVLLPRWRPVLLGALALLLGFGIVVLPWMVRNQLVQGTFAIAGGSGEGLAVRTIRYDQKFDFREPPGGDQDRTLQRARRIYRDEAADGSAFELAARLRDELGVSEIEAERLMRTIALQAILKQPGYYLSGTADMLVQTFVGRPVRLRQDWLPWRNIAWPERVRHLLPSPSAVEERSFGAAERLVTLYDPARLAPLLAVLALVGSMSGLRRRRPETLLVGLLVFFMLLAGAALIGIEWRYRFPLDPLVNVLVGGGVAALAGFVWAAVGRFAAGGAARTAATSASPR